MRTGAMLALLCALGCGEEVGFTKHSDPDPVKGEGRMQLSTESLHWQDMAVGVARSIGIVVTSVGEHTLQIRSGVVTQDPAEAYYTDEAANEGIDLDNGDSREFLVVCHLQVPEEAAGVFRLESNDVDRPVLDIPLLCTPIDEDTGL